jgi:hypothetical protein
MRANNGEQILEFFKGADVITKSDIKASYIAHYNVTDSDHLDARISKLIYRLRSKGRLISIKSGLYKIETKKTFLPAKDILIQKIHNLFKKRYPEISYCIWSTQCLHQFMNLQPFRHFYVFETEKDMLDSAFYLFKENNIDAYINPGKEITDKYILNRKNAVVIKQITSRSPLIESLRLKTPMLEKILVDVFFESDIFFFYQGNELKNIFEFAFKNYHINYSKLLNYADRRKQKTKIIQYLKENIPDSNQNLLV